MRGAQIIPHPVAPKIYLGGSSAVAIEVAAAHADVYLTWGGSPSGRDLPGLERYVVAERFELSD